MKCFRILPRFIAFLLAICLLTAFIPVAYAAEGDIFFQTHVENAYTHKSTIGNFLLTAEGELYMEEDTLSCVIPLIGTNTGAKRSDGVEMSYADLILEANGKRYLPFEKVMTGLSIGSHFDPARTMLHMYEGADVLSSYTAMDRVFLSDAYAMRYWQNSKTFGMDMASAIAADIVTNYRYISYASGEAVTEQYFAAFQDLIVPQREDEVLSAPSNLDRRLDLVDDYLSAFTDASLDALQLIGLGMRCFRSMKRLIGLQK